MSVKEKKIALGPAPSIGTVDLSFDEKGQRVRQIHTEPIDDLSVIPSVLEGIEAFAKRHKATRAGVRMFVATNKLSTPAIIDSLGNFTAEAAVPLDFSHNGYTLLYLSRNEDGRQSDPLVLNAERTFISVLSREQRKDPRKVISQTYARGYVLERLHGNLSEPDREDLSIMYATSFRDYPYDIKAGLNELVENPDTYLYVARRLDTGRLDAVSATEQVQVTLGGQRFTMREMGDSAKMPGSRGLNAPLKLLLIWEALQGNVDLLFTETRAALQAVNRVNYSIGMDYYGLLVKHTVISGEMDIVDEMVLDGPNGRYGNMNVWALRRGEIQQIGEVVESAIQK